MSSVPSHDGKAKSPDDDSSVTCESLVKMQDSAPSTRYDDLIASEAMSLGFRRQKG